MKRISQNFNSFSKLKKYFAVSQVAFKEMLFYPQRLRTTAILVPFRIFVMLLIYSYAFKVKGSSINGITAPIAIWSLSVYHILLFVQFRNIFRSINDEVRRGSMEIHLNKPYNYLLYKVFEQLGKGFPNLIISSLAVLPALMILTGGIPSTFNLITLIGAMFLIIGGTFVSAVLYLLTVLPALWIDDAQPFYWIVDKSILILGGSYVPIALLPSLFQVFVNITPFGAPMFATQMFNPNFSQIWPSLFGLQIFWFLVLFILVSTIYSRAQSRLSINGG